MTGSREPDSMFEPDSRQTGEQPANPFADPYAPASAAKPKTEIKPRTEIQPEPAPTRRSARRVADALVSAEPALVRTNPRGLPAASITDDDRSRDLERSRMDDELAAQKAALDATLRRPRDNRGNRRRGPVPPIAASVAVAAPLQPLQAQPPKQKQPQPKSQPRPQAQAMRTVAARKRRTGPILAMLLVVLIGFGLVVFGGLRATYLAPPTEITATLSNSSRVPVLATQVGLLGLEGPRTRVTVRAASSTSTVFLGIGRVADVDAYLGDVNRVNLVGVNDQGQLLTALEGKTSTLPDPAGTDVWVVSVRAKGAATVVWPKTGGQWRLIAATDGKAPAPASLEVSWSGRATETLPPVLIAIGFVLMVAGGVTLVMISSRTGLDDDRNAPDVPNGRRFAQGAKL